MVVDGLPPTGAPPGREELEAHWRRERRWVAALLLAHAPPGHDPEDLLQEVALAFVRGVGELRRPEALRAWLREAARNVARGAARRRRLDSLEEAGHEPSTAPRRECPPDSLAARVFERAAALPAHYREPLFLRALTGLAQREIAERLGISEEAVESRLARARRRLREETRHGTGTASLEDQR